MCHVSLPADIGDTWAAWWRFEGQHGGPEQQVRSEGGWSEGLLLIPPVVTLCRVSQGATPAKSAAAAISLTHSSSPTRPASPPPQEAVLKRCLAAEPRYGERWQRVAKDPAFAHQKPEAILKRVAADLDKPL